MAQEACDPAEKTAAVLRQLCYFLEEKAHDELSGRPTQATFQRKDQLRTNFPVQFGELKKHFADKYGHMAFVTSGLVTLLLPRTEWCSLTASFTETGRRSRQPMWRRPDSGPLTQNAKDSYS
jgi:hypothetical protein